MEPLNNGRIGYEAYAAFTNGKTFDGRDMPTWDKLPTNIQAAWQAATTTVLAHNGVVEFIPDTND